MKEREEKERKEGRNNSTAVNTRKLKLKGEP
jgi:hypothetical protein